ncbi:MAG: 50S ribosomal protein L11 methyltransferase [Tissierellia bacterium]|nr:50S ribosomal protein L11 methyltransferase [Tissierellia bacterium]
MKWKRIEVVSNKDFTDIISLIFYNNDASGLEIIDPSDIDIIKNDEESWAVFDRSEFPDSDEVRIRAYFEDSIADRIIENIKRDLRENRSIGQYSVNVEEIDDEDFANNWKAFYKPISVGEKLLICPEWEKVEPSDRIVIKIDPGMAFGTGDHETTKLSLQAMERYVKPNMTVFDIGTGSGILAVAAKRLGAKEVIATDIDSLAIKASSENAKLNNVEFEVREGNLLDVVEEKADLIVSNIIAEILVKMIPDMFTRLNKDGLFIASGVIDERMSMMKDALGNFEILEIIRENGWNAIISRVKDE